MYEPADRVPPPGEIGPTRLVDVRADARLAFESEVEACGADLRDASESEIHESVRRVSPILFELFRLEGLPIHEIV